MTTGRLFIVDAMAMAFRNFHALERMNLSTSSGTPTSAVFGSLSSLLKLLEEEKPEYMLVASDCPEPTFRHQMYADYKGNRGEMPEELAKQLPYLERLFSALKLPLIKQPGVEADDLIGSVVTQFQAPGLEHLIVSGDKDFMQLVSASVKLYNKKRNDTAVVIDAEKVREKFGCEPQHVIDALAMIGDTSDNVPGVAGIGGKGAAQLISQFGSLEDIYANLPLIANARQRTALEKHKEAAFLSRDLVTIKTDCPLPINLEDTRCAPDLLVNNHELLELVEELEFRGYAQRLRALNRNHSSKEQATAAPGQQGIDAEHPEAKQDQDQSQGQGQVNSAHEHIDRSRWLKDYRLVKTQQDLDELCDYLSKAQTLSVDTETTGLDITRDEPIGISFSTESGTAWYVPLCKEHLAGSELNRDRILSDIDATMRDHKGLKVAHNLKFDLQMLKRKGLDWPGPWCDTMVMHYLLYPVGQAHGLDACCLEQLNYQKLTTESLIGKATRKGGRGSAKLAERTMLEVPIDDLGLYACEDADLTLRLFEKLLPDIESANLADVLHQVDMPLVPVLAAMEAEGVYVDAEALADLSEELGETAERLRAEIHELAGEEFNVQSTKQLQVILFEKLRIHEKLGITRLKKTKSGYSTDMSVLEKLKADPLVAALIEYRGVAKLKNTYVDTLPQLIRDHTRRVHTTFHQTVTATGRLSSADPNLQNIPIRSSMGKVIRRAFRPQQAGHSILSADYSQIELRLLAHLSEDEGLIAAYKKGEDIHAATAAKVFGVQTDQVTSDQRAQAKAINFGIIYGMGPQRLAQETGVSMNEAKDFISRYFESYPKIRTYIDQAIAFAREHGYSKTLSGRKRPIPELSADNNQNPSSGGSRQRLAFVNAQNIATNSPVQGSAADLIKIAMTSIHRTLKERGLKSKMLLQVHDELVFECPDEEIQELREVVRSCMEGAMDLKVPLVVEVGTGDSWLAAH